MSLYGNIKRIGSSTFQFDKVYPNRVAMDTADDVIYVGRYVLVEYGERYRQEGSERIQNEEYKQNQNIDLTTYGNVYDSTVWQRVYLTTSDNEQKPKYIMVAELNALAPKLELEEIAPLTATLSSSGEVQNLYYDEDAEASGIQGTPFTNISSIERNIPVFDEKQDTELTYKLKMPTPLELNVIVYCAAECVVADSFVLSTLTVAVGET